MNENDDKVFLKPGDLVMMKLDIPYKPLMVVFKIVRSILRNDDGKDFLRGVKTRWFTKDGLLQEAVFSTKDLILVNDGE